MNRHRVGLSIAGALVLCLAAVTILRLVVAKPNADTIRVGIATWPGFGPGYIAQEQGYFQDLRVEFLILDDFVARQQAFTSGKTQATISTLDSFAFESGQGVPGKIGLILDESHGADAIVAHASIKTAADLKGKRIAFTRGSPSHFFLIVFLNEQGLALQDVTQVQVDDPGRAGEALLAGSVDAAVTWEPNITQLVSAGHGHVLASTRTLPSLIVDGMVFSPQLLQTRPKDVERFVEGWLRAVDFVKSHPAEAYRIMSRQLQIPESEFPQMASGLQYADRSRNGYWLAGDGISKAADLFDQATAVWRQEGMVKTPQVGAERVTSAFLPAGP